MSDNFFKWKDNPQAEAILTNEWGKKSAPQIAAEINTRFSTDLSAHAIIGRANRIGLPRIGRAAPDPNSRRSMAAKRLVSSAPKKQKPLRGINYGGGFAALTMGPPLDCSPVPLDISAPSSAIDLMSLTNETCRFPFEPEPKRYLFCGSGGADLLAGRPYCHQHAAKCFYPKR